MTLVEYLKVRKKYDSEDSPKLNRVLTVMDLTFLGVGGMLGMGVYIMSGDLALTVGPAMLISFILAGLASILSAFCYAEFAGRAPGTGSAYAYCYITVGEFIAFLLGWNLVLEFVIGTATLVRGLSGYIDSLSGKKMSSALANVMPMKVDFFSSYPDFFSLLIMLIFSGFISFGVKESSIVNNILFAINIITISILVVIGFMHANLKNWSIKAATVSSKFDAGTGGFAPFGVGKVLQGAATCFYAYTGFDTVATTGGEAKNPTRAIPLALVFSLSIAILVYSLVSSTFTLMWPFYDQRPQAPYPYILDNIDLSNMKWVVSVGATAAITGSTLASTFGMSRIVYSIAADGLLFSFLGKVNKKTKTPISATLVSGLITGLLSTVFDTVQLIDMTSLGTLMAYAMVALCVLLLRYEPNNEKELEEPLNNLLKLKSLLNLANTDRVTNSTYIISVWSIIVFTLCSFFMNVAFVWFMDELSDLQPAVLAPVIVLGIFMFISYIIIQRQPREDANLTIKVKPVPLVPLFTIFINIHLMLRLKEATWIRFGIWLVIGFLIYFFYGIRHSKERPYNKIILPSNKA